MKTRHKSQRGQGLVEFALVLPILLLLTLGTILLTLSYIQKARMNGLAYMSARVAAVRRPDFDASAFTLRQYGERSGQRWLSEVSAGVPAAGTGKVAISLRKPGERLDVLANMISGQPTTQPLDLMVQIQMPKESTDSGNLRPQTFTQVDYQYKPRFLGELLDKLPNGMLDATQLADRMNGTTAERNRILSLDPPNERLKSNFYTHKNWHWDTALSTNSEAASGQFASMQRVYNNFKLIEAGGSLLDLIADFLGFAGPLKELVGDIGAEAAGAYIRTMSEITRQLDENLRSSYRSGGGL
ncbi:MAG: TadE/TadG family type IV pilus assembly protein [Candidatus Sericytochromatia bacterium]